MMSKKPKMPKAGDGMKDAMAMPRFGARAMRPGGMAKGGKIHADAAMDKKLIRKEIARAEKMEHKDEAKDMKAGGEAKKMFRGGMPGSRTLPARTLPAANSSTGSSRPMPGSFPRGAASPAANVVRGGSAPAPAGGEVRAMPRGMKKGGYAKMARGGGVETKGKTKGKFV